MTIIVDANMHDHAAIADFVPPVLYHSDIIRKFPFISTPYPSHNTLTEGGRPPYSHSIIISSSLTSLLRTSLLQFTALEHATRLLHQLARGGVFLA